MDIDGKPSEASQAFEKRAAFATALAFAAFAKTRMVELWKAE